jgi:hypothetical protein
LYDSFLSFFFSFSRSPRFHVLFFCFLPNTVPSPLSFLLIVFLLGDASSGRRTGSFRCRTRLLASPLLVVRSLVLDTYPG